MNTQVKETLEEQVLRATVEDWDRDSSRLIPHEIYHYTNSDVVKEILSPTGICFWMTHYEDFEDKLEGKCVEIYCDLALERLCREGHISEEERTLLAETKIPKRLLFYGDPLCPVGKSVETVAYVCCFSKEKESDYMFENYIKTKDKKGFCIEFASGNLFQNHIIYGIKDGYRFEICPVLYGEEVIESFKEFVLQLKSKYGAKTDWISVYGRPLLGNYMQGMQFAAKRGKYRSEQEIRLVLYKGKTGSNCGEAYPEFCNNGKRFAKIILPHNSLHNIYKSPSVTYEEDREMRKLVRERNYHDIEWA